MATVRHAKVSGVPNPADPTLVGGEDWDDDHTVSLVDADIPATLARDTEVTAAVAAEATLARNADNLASGTVADARIAATIARDSEVTSAVSAEATARDAAIASALADTTNVHGIADTANVVLTNDARLTDARTPTGAAGGDLGGTYPNPSVTDDSHAHTSSTLPGLAPTAADYLVGTANGGLSAEIVVGPTPGGELGGTWPSPTVDATHSGSSHAGLSGQPGSTDVAVADGGTGASTAGGARTNLGLVIGTDVRAQGSGDPTLASLGLDADLATFAVPASTTISAFGASLVDDAAASDARTTLGLGTAALSATGDFDAAGAAAAAQAASQPLDSDLTTIAAIAPSNDDIIQRKAGAWTNRTIAQLLTDLGLGALYQPLDSDLTAFANLAIAADKLPYGTGSHTLGLADLTAAGRALLDDADAAAQLTTLGVSAFIKTLLDDADAATARATLGAGTSSLAGDRKIQAGPYTTTSGTVVDVDGTNLVITMTTGARRVLLLCQATYKISAISLNAYLDVKIDAAAYLAAANVYGMTSVVNQKLPIAFSYLTDVLSAGSHTFKLGFAVDSAATLTLENVTFLAIEQAITA